MTVTVHIQNVSQNDTGPSRNFATWIVLFKSVNTYPFSHSDHPASQREQTGSLESDCKKTARLCPFSFPVLEGSFDASEIARLGRQQRLWAGKE